MIAQLKAITVGIRLDTDIEGARDAIRSSLDVMPTTTRFQPEQQRHRISESRQKAFAVFHVRPNSRTPASPSRLVMSRVVSRSRSSNSSSMIARSAQSTSADRWCDAEGSRKLRRYVFRVIMILTRDLLMAEIRRMLLEHFAQAAITVEHSLNVSRYDEGTARTAWACELCGT